jgi:hypothetical protein
MELNLGSLFIGTAAGQRLRRLAVAAAIPLLMVGTVSAQTIITFPWDWHISVLPNGGTPTNPQPGDVPVPIWLWGTATMQFGQPRWVGGDDTAPATFDLGPGGVGPNTPTAQAPPMGGIYEIPIELLSMDLHSMMDASFPQGPTPVIIRESPTRPSQGMIRNLRNNGDGTVQLDSFFDIFTEIDLPALGMQLHNQQPMGAGMSFGTPTPAPGNMMGDPLPELDILWGPTWVWNTYPPGTAPTWVDASFHPWDWWVTIHGHVTVPEPSSSGLLLVSLVITGLTRVRRQRN